MRKYVAPIVALLGIALLSPHANAANMIVKSRAIPAGGAGSLPVSVTNVSANQLWGADLAVTFSDPAVLSAGTFASTGAAFEPRLAGATGASPTDVVVSGTSFVGTNKPSMYWGYVRGTAGMETTAGDVTPETSLGLMKVQVAAGATRGTVVNLNPVAYDVKNDGTGNDVSRPAATGATSTATAGAAVANEAVTVLDVFPGYTAPAAGQNDVRLPLHKVAVGQPGDVDANDSVTGGDAVRIIRALNNLDTAAWTEYRRIAGDVFPPNNYAFGSNLQGSGAKGGSYGDGQVTGGDAVAIIRYVNPTLTPSTGFPRPE